MSSKRPRISSQETRKIRKILNEEVRLGLNTNSDSETEEVDLKKEMYPLGHYINDREEMIEQMFSLIKGPKLERMLPPILKDMPLDELKADCLIHLLGMSKKRILSVLDGKEINSSSESELEPENSPSPKKKKKKSRFTPMIIKQEGCSDISDNSEEVVLVDPDIEEESVIKSKSKKQSKNEETKNSKKSKRRKNLAEKSKLKTTKPAPVKPEKKVTSSPAQEISSDGEAQPDPGAPREGKTLLEILELEMRARAIRALLTKGDKTVTVSEESSTSKGPSTATAENEEEVQKENETDSKKVTPTKNFRKQSKDKSDDIILVSPKVVTIDLTDETEGSSTKKVIDAEHQIEELDNLLSSVSGEKAEGQLVKSKDQSENEGSVNVASKEQAEVNENSDPKEQSEANEISGAKDQAKMNEISEANEQAEVNRISNAKEQAKVYGTLGAKEQVKVNEISEVKEQVEVNEMSVTKKKVKVNEISEAKEQAEVNEISDSEDQSPVIIEEIVLTGNKTSESEEGEVSDEDEVISIADSPKNEQTENRGETEEQKSNWARRWLESDQVKKVVKTSKICGTIRKRIKSARLAKNNEPVKTEEQPTNPIHVEIEGRVEEYAMLTSSQANLAGGHENKSESSETTNILVANQQETTIEQVQDVSSTKVDTLTEKGLDESENVGPNETIDSALGTSVDSSAQDTSGDLGDHEHSPNEVIVDSTLSIQSNTDSRTKENPEESQTGNESVNSTNGNLDTSEAKENELRVPEAEIENTEPLEVLEPSNNSTMEKVVGEIAVTSVSLDKKYQYCDSNECDNEEVTQELTSNDAECVEICEDSTLNELVTQSMEISDLQNKAIKSSKVEILDCNEPETLEISIDDDDTDFE